MLCDANLGDQMSDFEFMRFFNGLPHVEPMVFQAYHEGHDFRPCAVFNPLLLGLLGILGR